MDLMCTLVICYGNLAHIGESFNQAVLLQQGFPYFCSNLVKIDEFEKLGKIYNDNVETLRG